MIDKETIDKIYGALDIVEIVSDFVSLKKRGVNYLGNCPFHNEKTPSFTVSPSKGIYKCFGCGKGGNAVNFIMEHEHLNYTDTLKWLARKYNIEIVEKEITPEQKEQKDARESMMLVNAFAQKVFSYNLHETDEGRAVGLSYFKERGFTEKTIKKFELGYSRKGYDIFSKQALQRGYREKYLISTGLTIKRDNGAYLDRFHERVMFPIHNLMGRVIAFGGRALRTDKKIAKYLNSPESEVYHKSDVLYGIFFAKKAITKNDRCYLVEGYTDVISMHQAGIENVVASSGTSLTPGQIRLIRRFTKNVTVLYDGDAAGIKAALRGIDLVLEEAMNVKVVLLPDGEDPDSFAQKYSATEFYDFIKENETDFITFKTKLLLKDAEGDPVKKAHLITDIVRTISVIPETITRSLYVKECSSLMNIDEKALHTELNKILYKKKTERWKKEQQAAPVNPSGKPLTDLAVSTEKHKEYEKEIIRLLLTYPKKVLFRIKESDTSEEEEICVGDYICREVEGEIEFKAIEYKTIFEEFKENLIQGKVLDSSYFVNHENEIVAQTAANILAGRPELSKMWSKKGSFINTEEDDLKKVIDKAIAIYKSFIVMEVLKEIMEEMKNNPDALVADDDSESDLFIKFQKYTKYKQDISEALGERIILPST